MYLSGFEKRKAASDKKKEDQLLAKTPLTRNISDFVIPKNKSLSAIEERNSDFEQSLEDGIADRTLPTSSTDDNHIENKEVYVNLVMYIPI